MIDHSKCFQVPSDAARVRLDRYLLELEPGQSRSQIQGWIRSGSVLVNNSRTKTGYLLRPGDVISLQLKLASPQLQPQPENIPLHVIYQDEDLAVVDKPAGLVCHAGAGVPSGTLVNALLYHLGPLQTGDALRPGIVHRLDKLTSGLLVIAKNLETHRALARQFKSRQVKKEYLALVYGRPIPPAGTIDMPLGRDLRDRKKISVRSRRRRAAVTHYREAGDYGPFSLLRVRIETGRTHQIRVHLAQMGHPVAGDILYGGNRSRNLADARLRSAVRDLRRHFLHAQRLEFRHPRTGENLSFTAGLPPELTDFLILLQHHNSEANT
ncbi:MAG: RluA family pseudouridine synthase [Acidobacteriia bacterium]|nr:RluA family pseudouridine synthase [Terriglobia bacterium]